MKKFSLIFILLLLTLNFISSQIDDSLNDIITIPKKENYLDIKSVSIEVINKNIEITLTMNGDIPQSNYYETIFIEWDIMIDIDQDSTTYTWKPWSESVNDIGVEYMIGVMLHKNKLQGRYFNHGKKIDKTIPVEVNQNIIKIKLKKYQLENVDKFDFTILARKYVGYGNSNSLVYYDKMPNAGHFTFLIHENIIIQNNN
jgi:hypothetical protein